MTFWCATLPGFKKHISLLSLTIAIFAIANLQFLQLQICNAVSRRFKNRSLSES
jgi:ABC-type uncharacterized transport system permease subunit